MNTKSMVFFIVVLMTLVASNVFAGTLDLNFENVEVNGRDISTSGVTSIKDFERGDQIEVTIELVAQEDINDAEIEVEISGYEHGTLSDTTEIFDIDANHSQEFTLMLDVPKLVDEDEYELRISVKSRRDKAEESFLIKFDVPRHSLAIDDVVFANGRTIKAGDVLIGEVRVKNYGEKDEQDVKVTLRIPELDKQVTDFMEEIEYDEELSSEEMYINIDPCQKAGTYDVEAIVSYNDGYDQDKRIYKVNIVENVVCSAKVVDKVESQDESVISLNTETKELTSTKGAVYPITITNLGNQNKIYIIQVSGYDSFANLQLDQNVVTVGSKQTVTVQPFLTLKEGVQAGTYAFAIKVMDETTVVEQYALSASVAESVSANTWDNVKKGLEIGLIVLVVLLIILGLIVGFNKLKRNDDDDEDEDMGQTYY